MSRRSKVLGAGTRSGSRQAARELPALDPSYALVDERGHAERLAFAQQYAKQLVYFDENDQPAGDWGGLLSEGEAVVEEMLAHLREPQRTSPERTAWLGRPHLALLLAFVELLGHAREQLNTLTARHLDFYYERVLGLLLRPPMPDRATALIRLARGVDQLRLPVGTSFRAGLDSEGKARIYRSERELFVNRAEVAELRSVFVDRRDSPPDAVGWRNIYPHADASAVLVEGADPPRWRTFGQIKPTGSPTQHPAPVLGVALRSPLLALSEGTRVIHLTLCFEPEGFDETRLNAAIKADALVVEVSTAKGWVELTLDEHELDRSNEGQPELRLSSTVATTIDPLEPLAGDSGERWPVLRLMLRQIWDYTDGSYRIEYSALHELHLAAVHLCVTADLAELRLRNDERPLDASKPFEPFGRSPAVGSRLYFSHPELGRSRLESLKLNIEWIGKPKDLVDHYANYPAPPKSEADFMAKVVLVDRGGEHDLADHEQLFPTGATPALVCESKLELEETSNPDRAGRYFYLELTPRDFGHGSYAAAAASKARAFAEALAKDSRSDQLFTPFAPWISDEADAHAEYDDGKYAVPPPYTPKIKSLRVGYSTRVELRFDGKPSQHGTGAEELLHVHPFGMCRAPAEHGEAGPRGPRMFPTYEHAGELYIGLHGLEPPQRLNLLFELAEGSANLERTPPPVQWSILDGDDWRSLLDGGLIHDTTHGLTSSGIVELELDAVAPRSAGATRLPAELHWLRAAVPDSPDAVCDALALHTQAVSVVFDDQDNAADHYDAPLPPDSIDRLLEPRREVAEVAQPYTSFGGRPAERAQSFRGRVSERLRHKNRALTPWDYERLVLDHCPQLYMVKCLRATMDEPVRVIVIPNIHGQSPRDPFAPRAPTSLLGKIQRMLARVAPDHARIEVHNPHYVAVMVRVAVHFRSAVDVGYCRRQLVADINRHLAPWAYEDGADLCIGGRIYANSIIDFIDRLDYVEYATDIHLFRSLDGETFKPVRDTKDAPYCVTTEGPDQVLVPAREHQIDLARGDRSDVFYGIGYMKIELDFQVAETTFDDRTRP